MFTYSDRDIAKASKFENKIPKTVKKQRTKLLRELSDIKKGTTFSLETRKKMSDAAKIRVLNSERNKDGKFK